MRSIKNISERNKIVTQSRASLDAPKSILETEKTLKTPLSSGQIYKKKKKKKKTKNPKKTKKPKKTHWAGFFKTNPDWRRWSWVERRPPFSPSGPLPSLSSSPGLSPLSPSHAGKVTNQSPNF
jgi:hypothetical protein